MAHFHLHDIEERRSGLCFAVDDQMYHTHIYGAFQAMNLTAVIAVCSLIKMEKNQIRQCIENLLPLSGRMQKIWQDPLVFIDYAHTASACMALFNTVRRLPHDKIITVIGCGGERDEQKRSVMGRLASEASTLCIFTSDNPRSESLHRIFDMMRQGGRV